MRYLDRSSLVVMMDGDTPRYLTDRWGNVAYPYKDTYDKLNALKRPSLEVIEAMESGEWRPVVNREPTIYRDAEMELIDGCLFQLRYSKWLKKGVQIKEQGNSAMLRDSNGMHVMGISRDRWLQCTSI